VVKRRRRAIDQKQCSLPCAEWRVGVVLKSFIAASHTPPTDPVVLGRGARLNPSLPELQRQKPTRAARSSCGRRYCLPDVRSCHKAAEANDKAMSAAGESRHATVPDVSAHQRCRAKQRLTTGHACGDTPRARDSCPCRAEQQ
jgi:hypothetical protein